MNKQESECNDTTNDTASVSVPNVCCGIYGLRNKANGKWYVGQSTDILSRWNRAYKGMRCQNQHKIYRALKKYGYDGFDKIILEECGVEQLDSREVYWSEYYDSINNGYNLRVGGGRKGALSFETKEKLRARKFTDEWKQKISDSKKGKTFSEEHRAKLKVARNARQTSRGWKWTDGQRAAAERRKGTKQSPESNEKRRIAMTGFRHTDETKAKLSQLALGRKMSESAKEKLQQINTGKKHTDESKKRMSEYWSDRPRGKYSPERIRKLTEAARAARLAKQSINASCKCESDHHPTG